MRWGVGPVEDEFGACEDGADGFTLDADSFAMNNPHDLESLFMGQVQVLLHHGFNIAGSDGVEIQDVRDLYFHRVRKRIIDLIFIHTLI